MTNVKLNKLTVLLASILAMPSYSATDLSSVPLSNTAGSLAKPNIMMMFDDSGSMLQEYTPDYVSDIWDEGANKKSTLGSSNVCIQALADRRTSVWGGYDVVVRNNNLGNILKRSHLCVVGDVPYMSSAVNYQYYNPQVQYKPPRTANGSTYQSMDGQSVAGGANTSFALPNWRAVKTDGFGIINRTQWEPDNSYTSGNLDHNTVNLESGIPDRKWCKVGTTLCKTNTSGYRYPNTVYNSGRDISNTDLPLYDYSAPYYYTYDSTISFYNSDLSASKTKYIDGSYTWPSYLGDKGLNTSPYVDINVDTNTSSNKTITISVVVNNITYGSFTTTSGNTATDTANNIAAAINSSNTPVYAYVNDVANNIIRVFIDASGTTNSLTLTSAHTSVKFKDPNAGGSSNVSKSFSIQTPAATVPAQGTWTRVNILPGNTYTKYSDRTDCAGASCTYAEEMTNYANWYSYYRTRLQSLKTATATSFNVLDQNYRVGLWLINSAHPESSDRGIRVDSFTGTQRDTWYSRLNNIKNNGGTPLRKALSNAGRYYAGQIASLPDPMEYSCQKNNTFLVTDGYWNGDNGVDLSDVSIADQDGVSDSGYSKRSDGVYDGLQSASTLADTAFYYYKTDIRNALYNNCTSVNGDDLCTNNGLTSDTDKLATQHMNTYTMGLGIDGLMSFTSNYSTKPAGSDFTKIATGATGCSWLSPTAICNWPSPTAETQSTVDDLWHAAVNGRGSYFSAKNPTEAATGMQKALGLMAKATGAAAASATSSPNITPTDNYIFSTTYETLVWSGEVVAQRIDETTGNILPTVLWRASESVNNQANASTRTLFTFDAAQDKIKTFTSASLTATEKAWFTNLCSVSSPKLSQCNSLSAGNVAYANDPVYAINFIRGYNTYNSIDLLPIFNPNRVSRLGDTVNATPVYVKAPLYKSSYVVTGGGAETYEAFKTRVADRPGTLYIAANDGFIHAFDGMTGLERWAYAPRMNLPNLYKLADANYSSNHKYFVDGSPLVTDIYDTGAKTWKTVLIQGMAGGNKGFVALDITDPTSPKALWEVCDTSVCNNTIADLGYSYGNPILTRLPESASLSPTLRGKWVALVSSGHNNASGVAKIFVLDAMTGALIDTYNTNTGTAASPAGMSKLAASGVNFDNDRITNVVYGGDLLGNIWRFDLGVTGGNPQRVVTLENDQHEIQPITGRMELAQIDIAGTRATIIYAATGKYLGTTDLSAATADVTQSIYAIRDPFETGAYGNTYSTARGTGAGGKRFIEQVVSDVDGIRTTTDTVIPWNDASTAGWYIDLPDVGERATLDLQLYLGTLIVSTNVINPTNSSACSVGGYSWMYQLDYKNGTYLKSAVAQSAATKYNSAILVGNVVVSLPSGAIKIISTTAKGDKWVDALVTSSSSIQGKRVSWRELPL